MTYSFEYIDKLLQQRESRLEEKRSIIKAEFDTWAYKGFSREEYWNVVRGIDHAFDDVIFDLAEVRRQRKFLRFLFGVTSEAPRY